MLPLKVDDVSSLNPVLIAVLGFVLVIVVLAVLAVFVKLLSALVRASSVKGSTKTVKTVAEPEQSAVPSAPLKTPLQTELEKRAALTPTEIPAVPGFVTLDGVSEQDAAAIMAITSYKTKIPLERLLFSSIKREPVKLVNVSEQDAAVVMAITCDKLKAQPEKLYFKSIKLMEE